MTKDFKRVYSGDARIMVQLGEEYVYSPVGQATNGNGMTTTIDTITLTEAAIMKNGQIIDQIIGEMSSTDAARDRFAKDKFAEIRAAERRNDERARQDAYMELRKEVDSSYVVMPRPKSSIIDVMYKHENPAVAVEVTNAFVNAYLAERRKIFVGGSGEVISERREATERQLSANERAIARFLEKNNISDFDSEQGGLRKRTEDTKALLNTTRASIAETEAALAKVEDLLRGTPETINLYVDDRASQRVAQAELELGQLMAKYLPNSDPVRQKKTELAELRALKSSYNGQATGGRRVGPNLTHQALVAQRNTFAATANSLRDKEYTLQQQLNSADAKVRRLTKLSPEYQNLLRERDTLNVRLSSYNAKEQESLVDAQQAEAKAENVKVISYAKYPNKGRNMRALMFLLATAGWGLTLFFIAAIRVFLDPRLYAVPGQNLRAHADVPMDVADEFEPEDYHHQIPEAVPAYAPTAPLPDQNPYAQPAAAQMAPQMAPAALAQPFADNYGQYHSGQPAQPGYAGQTTAYYSDGLQSAALEPNYAPTAYADPYGQQPTGQAPHQPGYADVSQTGGYDAPQFAGNAALDLSYNPYASGQSQAGALDDDGQPLPPPVS